jgi:hypothetical protein
MILKKARVLAHLGPTSTGVRIGGINICKNVLSRNASSTPTFGAFSVEKGDVDTGSF